MTDPILTCLVDAISMSLDFWNDQFGKLELSDPPSHSMAADELAQSPAFGDVIDDPVAAALGLAIDTLRGASQSLEGALRCVSSPALPLAASSPLRTTFEGSLRACWWLDPTIGSQTRSERLVREYRALHIGTAGKFTTIAERSNKKHRTHATSLKKSASAAREQIDELDNELLAAGYQESDDVFKATPPMEQLAESYLAGHANSVGGIGIVAYQQLSGPAHLTAYGLKRHWGDHGPPDARVQWSDWSDDKTPIVEDATYALTAHGLAVGFLVGVFGGSIEDASDCIDSINSRLAAAWRLCD